VLRFLHGASSQREVLGAPEAADAECAFTGRVSGAIAVEQGVTSTELLLDARPGAAHPRRRGLLESIPGNEQETGVDAIAVEAGDVAAQRRIPGARLDLAADHLAVLRERIRGRLGQIPFPVQLQEAIQSRPAEQARVGI